jgi:hypothetical protein
MENITNGDIAAAVNLIRYACMDINQRDEVIECFKDVFNPDTCEMVETVAAEYDQKCRGFRAMFAPKKS